MKISSDPPCVCFVNDSGSRKQCRIGRVNLPFFISWPFPLFRLLYNPLGITVVYMGLKEETEARLNKAIILFRLGLAEKVFVSGKYEGNPEAPNVNKVYLCERGVPEENICADGYSLDTRGNVEQFLDQLEQCYPLQKAFRVFVVDGYYRMPRTVRILEEQSSLREMTIDIRQQLVHPKLTWRSFRDDYLFNIFAEKVHSEYPSLRNALQMAWRKTKKEF